MRFMKILALGLVFAGAFGLWWSFQDPPSQELPAGFDAFPGASVVLVTLDTTRADRFGCYGSEAGLTPFMDALAKEGVLFEQAQAVTPITLPSHASILTGLLPTTHEVRNNGMFSLSEEFETLAGAFSREGYATGAFISAQVLASRYGLDRGFDVYDDDLSHSLKVGQSMVPSRKGNLTLDRAISWLDTIDQEQPLFMWLHLYDPHAPYSPPPEFRQKFPADPYGGEIAFTDDLVRRLVEKLKASGRYESTILTIMADHGEALGEHGEKTHGILLHQSTIRVPWLLTTPAGRAAQKGMRIERPVSCVDLVPILASLTEITPPNAGRLDGATDVLSSSQQEERDIYFEAMLPMFQYGWSPLRGLRQGSWQIINGRRSEIFNLSNDPRELVDLSESDPLQLEFLLEQVNAVISTDTTLDVDSSLDMKPSERAALEALGYLATTASARPDPPDPRDLVTGHVHVELSRDLMAAGRSEEALREIDLMLKDDPENLAALNLKAQLFLQLGRMDEAEAILRRSLEFDLRNSDVIANLGRLEMARGHFQAAIELARLGRKSRSPFGTFDVLEARALSALGREPEADELVRASLEKTPDDADLLLVRATQRIRAGQYREAEADLRHAVTVDPFHSPTRQALGQLLQSQGQNDQAIRVYEDLLRINPTNAATLLSIGQIILQTDPLKAIPYLEESARLAPGKKVNQTTLGVAYIQADRVPDAEAALRRATALDPDDHMIRNNLAIVLIRQRKYPAAIQELQTIVASNPGFFQGFNNLAIVLGESGDLEGAEREARKALALQPDFLDARITLAAILHRTDRIDQEFETLEEVWRLAPDRQDIRTSLAIAAADSGRCQRTLDLLKAQLENSEAMSWEAHLASGTCLEKIGKAEEALRHFEEAARRSPPGERREEARQGVHRLSLRIGNDVR
ncbi:MAG: sulfatase-like hydrolase/transferase [Thermoanaerobaculales bacterium]|nr:sulfatase-like hydrolase/transferase [Thermoanaerobaculales bacterium]